MKYPLLLMRVLGLYHHSGDKWYSKIYPLLVILFLWGGFGRFISLFEFWYGRVESSTAILMYKIITSLWCFIAAFNGSIFFINQEINSRQNKLIEELSVFLELYSNRNIKKLKKRIYVYFILGTISALLNSVTGFFSIFEPDLKLSIFTSLLDLFNKQTWSNNMTIKIINRFLMTYESFFWVVTIDYFLSQCDLLGFVFENLSLDFQSITKRYNLTSSLNSPILPSFEKEFNKAQINFFQLCKIVEQMNKCYSQLIGMNLIVYLTMILLLFYILTLNNEPLKGIMLFLYAYWTIIAFIIIFLIIINGIKFQVYCGKILNILLEINHESLTEKNHFKVNFKSLNHFKSIIYFFRFI